MLAYIKLKFELAFLITLRNLYPFYELLGKIGSKLLCNDLKSVIFQKNRHFEHINNDFRLITKEQIFPFMLNKVYRGFSIK